MSSSVHKLGASFLIDSLMGWTTAQNEKSIYDKRCLAESIQSKEEVLNFPANLLVKSATNHEVPQNSWVTEDNQTEERMDHPISSQESPMILPTNNSDKIKLENMERTMKEDSNILEKPNQSYIALISRAILSTTEKRLQLSDIYQWIMDTYPYYHNQDKSWRNSVRHNLSLNECFIKAGRSDNGKGHYWAVHPANLEAFSRGDYQRRRARRRIRRVSSVLGNSSLFPLYNIPCFHQRLCICCSPPYTQSSQTQLCPIMANPRQQFCRSLAIPNFFPWNQPYA
ncbi:hypothetical protein GDO81_001137 [Engystomops pustulosus]|uniref:Fork-head domain-containing protein n=1 Tax=Engystomops pustulosus TaxID=76066 RepID=A0AAV7DBE4_ENGPU|nr:hypothetical protein GDO81_001137 [Engystomops pustulosus]